MAALFCLAVGVGLLLWGAISAVRHRHGWARVPVIAVIAFVSMPVAFAFAMATAATYVPRVALGSETPSDRGLDYRDVAFEASDGVRLSGWYLPSTNGAAVILLHGAHSTRSNVLDHAAVLAADGYGVLLFDARGHGESGGRAMELGWYGDQDVTGAVSFVASQPDVTAAIGVIGLSMGGEEAIGAAAADGRIHAVIAEGATNRVAGDLDWLADEYGMRGWIQGRLDWLRFSLTDVLTAASPPITLHDAVEQAAPTPFLLITAGNVKDESVAARELAASSPSTVEVWDVPDTAHTKALATHPVEWESRVTSFLARTLHTTSPLELR
jgi:pimeloyl-ACP methyl ester carboxylesterase